MKSRAFRWQLSLLLLVAPVVLPAQQCTEILPTPPASPDFTPVGETPACLQCGQQALAQCQQYDPDSHPRWFGFNASGRCQAVCTGGAGLLVSGVARAPGAQACAYDITTTLVSTDEVCPVGPPTVGDWDFYGHGPRIDGRVTIRRSAGNDYLIGSITATWKETEYDDSEITLSNAPVGIGISSFAFSPPFAAPRVGIAAILSDSTTTFGPHVMEESQESVLTPLDADPLVYQLLVVGDTSGTDISDDDNCNDDARVRAVVFNPVRVRIGPI